MPSLNETQVPSATFVQFSQSYLSMGSSGSYSPMILDVPQSPTDESPGFYLTPISVSTSPYSVLLVETAGGSTSNDNGQSFTFECPTEPLYPKEVNSLVLSDPEIYELSRSSVSNDPKNGPFELLEPTKRNLATRRGVPKLLGLDLPLPETNPETSTIATTTKQQADAQEPPPITPLDQMIPNPISPPPAPPALLTIKSRRLSSTSASTRTIRPSRFYKTPAATAASTTPPANSTRSNDTTPNTTPALEVTAFITVPRQAYHPNRPLLSPIRLTQEYLHGTYRPAKSPMDSDLELYGAMSTPTSWSPVHAG